MAQTLSSTDLVETPLKQLYRLDGQVAVVTGGARGLGKAIAARLCEAGAHVMVADVNDDVGRLTAQELSRNGATMYQSCDVTRESDVAKLVAATVDGYGRIDILVNNAGIFPYSLALELEADDWDAVLSVNLRGPFLVCREVGRHMVAQGIQGSIVNISSLNAFRSPIAGVAHYDAAKAGLNALTRSLAVELGPHGIRVNAIAPGVNLTEGQREAFGMEAEAGAEAYPNYIKRWIDHTPLRRHGLPDDQARVVTFLASRAAAFITGQCLVVDGGAALV